MTVSVRDGKSAPTVNFGIVFHSLQQYRWLVHKLAVSPLVATTDFTYSAPIYKGSDRIKTALTKAETAIDKFDVYVDHALLDEEERVRFARLFHQAYLRRYPASERTDLFLASGEVLKFSFELVPPSALEDPALALDAIAQTPHDPLVLRQLKDGDPIDRAHLRADVKIFFDHVMNPRRRDLKEVQTAASELGCDEPYVVELVTDGAMPGYIYYTVHPVVHLVGGRLVLIPG